MVAVLQFFATILIARSVSHFGRSVERIDSQRSANSHWQELNKLVITDPEFRRVYAEVDGIRSDDESSVKLRSMVFYMLNTLEDDFVAQRLLNRDMSAVGDTFRELLTLSPKANAIAAEVLSGKHGYDPQFAGFCRSLLAGTPEPRRPWYMRPGATSRGQWQERR